MDSSPPVARISVVDSDLNGHPVCRHGPTLLLQEMSPKTNRRYYCCSSCRNRKDCDFYMSSEEWIQIQTNPKLKAKYLRKLVDMKSQSDDNRKYIATKCLKQMADNGIKFCRNCSLIISSVNELSDHKSHEVLSGITGRQLREPTKLMNSLTNNKFCAQYLFSDKTLEFIVNDILAKNGFQSVVSIGCPTVHEYISCRKVKLQMKSILLDIDDRYTQFYSRKKYLKFNLFNNHFFGGVEDEETFVRFIRKSSQESIVLLIDPPFGGLIEAMAKTIDKMSDIWRKCNQISDESQMIPILLFFPYFNEKRITTTIPVLSMSDFMVDYQNHHKFKATDSGRKFGSPVRIYTNIKLSSIVLPKTEGYYYCDYCDKYVSKNNKHCFECNDCTARDGKPYNHCYICKRCVKNTWNHCNGCGYCHLIQEAQELCKRKSFSNCETNLAKKKKK